MSNHPTMPVDAIAVRQRFRKDAGDVEGLAKHIEENGLIHPLAVWPDGTLACGWRRLEAVKKLGWELVPVHVLATPDDLRRCLVESGENTCRKDFLPSEAVAAGRQYEKVEAALAKERQGTRTDLEQHSDKLPEGSAGQTRDKVGAHVGMSGSTYEKAKAVVEAAEEDPEADGDLVREMDADNNVDRPHRKLVARRQKRKTATAGGAAVAVEEDARFRVEHADCLAWLYSQSADSIDLVFGSPPYEDARLYLEGGEDKGIARTPEEWVAWMVEVFEAKQVSGLQQRSRAAKTSRLRSGISGTASKTRSALAAA